MRVLALTILFLAGLLAAVVLFSVFPRSSRTADIVSAGLPTPTPHSVAPPPTPVPHSWIDGLAASRHGIATLVSCLDTNGDGQIDGADDDTLDGLHIPLIDGKACLDPAHHRDFYVGDPTRPDAYRCDEPSPPVLIVAIGSALTDLYDTTFGESLGVLDIVNALQMRASAAGITSTPILSDSAISSADEPQTRMEEWLTHDLEHRMNDLPCLRVVLIGHSHGGVAVTSIAAALEDRFPGRMFGALIDRTIALYDRGADEFPVTVPLLNLFQLNEGWHGTAIDLANVTNIDESGERAPVAPTDGGGGLALVSHKTLDDAVAVQRLVVDAAITWLTSERPPLAVP